MDVGGIVIDKKKKVGEQHTKCGRDTENGGRKTREAKNTREGRRKIV